MTTTGAVAPVRATDRVSDVLARDESLVEVFARHAPHFAKLRNRAMRRVMARLVTVEQAARTAGIPADRLLHDLNEALGMTAETADDAASAPVAFTAGAEDPLGNLAEPMWHPSGAPVREVDVREDLRSGREPFSRIMAAVGELGESEVLHLRVLFEPVPLVTVLARRGFAHELFQHAPDDWSAWFWRPADAPEQPASAASPAGAAATAAPAEPAMIPDGETTPGVQHTRWLDVRGLEPPEPLLRTLTALETLPEGHQLIQVNVRVPQFLIPMLGERGYACEIDESHADRVLVRIWRAA